MSLICKWMKSCFHIKRWAPRLVLQKRFQEIRKWPIYYALYLISTSHMTEWLPPVSIWVVSKWLKNKCYHCHDGFYNTVLQCGLDRNCSIRIKIFDIHDILAQLVERQTEFAVCDVERSSPRLDQHSGRMCYLKFVITEWMNEMKNFINVSKLI